MLTANEFSTLQLKVRNNMKDEFCLFFRGGQDVSRNYQLRDCIFHPIINKRVFSVSVFIRL